MGQIMAGFLEF